MVTIELLYSFRDTIDSSDIPSYKCDNSLRALKKAKEIKEKISSEYRSFETETFKITFEGNTLFFKIFYINLESMFYITPLPGEKKGISASCVGGYVDIVLL